MSLQTKSRSMGLAACAAAGALWGTGFFFGKIALREVSVGHMVLYRFLFAVLPMLALARGRGDRWTRRDWATLTVAAFFGVPLQFLVQFYGLSLTTLSHAALMIGTMPVILALAAAVVLHERMDKVGWAALAGSTLGACLIALGGHTHGGSSLKGDLLIVASLVIALVWILGNKDLLNRHRTLEVSARSLIVGTIMMLLWVCLQYGPPPVHGISCKVWVSLAASGLLCTASTTVLWNWGMTQVPASEAGIFLNMEPVIGSLLGVLVFHEQLGVFAWLGGALIVGSAAVLTARSPAAAEAAAMAPVE
jgi:drug/metabolite transporter (DMT)-like permease